MSVTQKIEQILKEDNAHIELKTEYGVGVDSGKLYLGAKEYFLFGEQTARALLDLEFGCNNCGSCCIDSETGEYCELSYSVGEKNEKILCRHHNKPKYPLCCFTYPFIVDIIGVPYQGVRKVNADKEVELYEFSLLDGLTLIIYPNHPCWTTPGKNLKELFEIAIKRIYAPVERMAPKHLMVGWPRNKSKHKEVLNDLRNRIKTDLERFKREVLNDKTWKV